MRSAKRIAALMLAVLMLGGCRENVPPTTAPTESTAGTTLPTTQPTEPTETTEPTEITEPVTQPTEPARPQKTHPTLSQMGVAPEDTDFVKIRDYIPEVQVHLYYATTENFTGQRIYPFADAYLRYGTVRKLMQVQQALAEHGMGLKIWDGYRPMSAQERLWEICPDPVYVSDPATGSCTHCRGSAVDVTLVELATGEELKMPSGFDEFSAQGDRDYSDCDPEAAANAALLEEIMVQCGFRPYSGEWWHYTDTDDYPIDADFDPVNGQFWYANCDEYISLREEPSSYSALLTTIPVGTVLRVVKWDTCYAQVDYEGQLGYALSSYLKPVDQQYLECSLDTVPITDTYTYEQMLTDLAALRDAHPDQVELDSIGQSELGRDLPVVLLGDPGAEYQVLIHGSIHAREHMCTWLLMALVDYWTDNGIGDFGDVCFHIVPMVNPDGVTISQTSELPEELLEIYRQDLEDGYTDLSPEDYARDWKANGKGVDLNRNFDAAWEEFQDRGRPSAERYKGEAPFSAAEANALWQYTVRHDFDVTISYHAMGSLIFYEYGSREDVNQASFDLSETISAVNGYLSCGADGLDAAGYKDWAIDSLGIPSLTIEIGCGSVPLDIRELDSIFARNLQVLPLIAQWVQK